MGKISELDTTIKDLRNAAAAINGIADTLAEMFSTVLADKSRAGHTAEVRVLLQKYGASRLSSVDPASYEALLADAEVLGNG